MSIQQMLLGASGASGYNIDKSLRFRASASAYLNRTPASAGNRKTWTWSGWVKRGTLGSFQLIESAAITAGSSEEQLAFNSNNGLSYRDGVSGDYVVTASVFRDPSSWYHVIFRYDSANATQADRGIFYVNGVRQTTSTSAIPLNKDSFINSTNAHALGRFATIASNYFDGYLADVNFIDGQALTPASFGETNALTGVWQPAPYTGTYGTNGFYLDFEDTSSVAALGTDSSGNGNTWTVNNVSLTAGVTYDSMTDVPTLTSATASNWCVMNAVEQTGTALSNGNLRVSTTANSWVASKATFSMPTGKWYAEFYFDAVGGFTQVGVFKTSTNLPAAGGTGYPGFSPDGYTFQSDGNLYNNGGGTAYGSSLTTGDILMVAYDADNSKLFFGKNGTWFNSSDPAAGTNRAYAPVGVMSFVAAAYGNNNGTSANFGQRPFAFSPPTGFVALNTFNLPTATILKGSDNFNIALDTGANIKTNTEALYPSNYLAWVKDRANANNHQLIDTVRGSTAVLQSNADAAETTYSAPSGSSVGWSWKAGGAAVSNTAGTITSQVSANTSAGFSIVTYTGNGTAGATVGHGLGVAPSVVIYKIRSASVLWVSYYKTLGATGFLSWSRNIAFNVDSTVFNNTAPTSSVLTLGTSGGTNSNTNTYVAYCFAPIDGYSAFLEYTGNGSADGTFVYCGFKPKYIMVKRSDSTPEWYIEDASRNSSNPTGLNLYTNLTNAEANDTPIFDFLSNGFKLRTSATALNASGGKYQCMVFAENPFKNSLAR